MSTEEQDVIAGRMAREYAESTKELAALLSEAERLGKILHAIGSYLSSRNASYGNGVRFGHPLPQTEPLPTAESVKKLCEEILALIARRRGLYASLEKMGIGPKESPILP